MNRFPSFRPLAGLIVLTLVAAPALAADAPPEAIRGFDPTLLDRTVAPCDDFYQFACGSWIAHNPIPADRSTWSRFEQLREHNLATLRTLLEEAAEPSPDRGRASRLAGDLFAACMDEAAAEQKGAEPIRADLDRIAAMESKSELPTVLARLHRQQVASFFRFGSDKDFQDTSRMVADVDQSGLGLPDRDYYFKPDEKSQQLRDAYLTHVAKTFELLGDSPDAAAGKAETVMALETALAEASLERAARREPKNIFHKMKAAELQALSPAFDWKTYLEGTGAPSFEELNVAVPDFVQATGTVIEGHSLDDLKTYLSWHVVRDASPLLSTPFVEEDFDFYGKTLRGTKEQRPRWKRCSTYVDSAVGDAIGQLFVQATFGAEGKERMLTMVHGLEKALGRDIDDLDWMTATTKKEARRKLDAINNKIGYPDEWKDYSGITISRDDFVGSMASAAAWDFADTVGKIGQPTDPDEWPFTAPTVNAGYSPLTNEVVFPAGILQPPFFDREMDDAVNYGAIGSAIGHELTHGFDDSGRQFGATGEVEDWWTDEDARAFEKRAACFEEQYSGYTAVADVKLNGKLTLGENVADNGGLRVALMALEDAISGKGAKEIDGFTPQQRFFLANAQVWCRNQTEEYSRMLATVDPHSPGPWRVNGVVVNMPEFAEAFSCPANAPMVGAAPCRVW
ncbi:MAG: M13 family metallopeptidase [Acidobacteria bacterium]|nr:M13 family metallopeptidase [Acidobacteriota bacterium]